MFLYCENRKWFGGLTTFTGGYDTSVSVGNCGSGLVPDTMENSTKFPTT